MSNVKSTVARNLTELRKEKNLTQGALAKMFNYSDKAVSKWECGDSLPDLDTLLTLANFYGVTLDELVSEDPIRPSAPADEQEEKMLFNNRLLISTMIVATVFLMATIVFVYGNMREPKLMLWITYVWAIPISCAALLPFYLKWKLVHDFYLYTQSLLLWSLLAALYLQIAVYSFWYLFLVGVPIQILIVLNHLLRTR